MAFIDDLKNEANYTRTLNGAVTYTSSMSYCLDLFSKIGAFRNTSKEDIINAFIKAYAENADLAMKCLFYARDIRGGLGERDVFRTIIKYLATTNLDSVIKNIDNIIEYGRYDDLIYLLEDVPFNKTQWNQTTIHLMDTVCNKILTQLRDDLLNYENKEYTKISLLAKWLPSENASAKKTVELAKKVIKFLAIDRKEYRQILTKLRKAIQIIENNLREKNYSFDYSKQPSRALFKYRKAFIRNDNVKYSTYLENVANGKVKLNTSNLTPYDIINPIYNTVVSNVNLYPSIYGWCHMLDKFVDNMTEEERKSLNVTWNALEDFTNNENAIVVADTSGSMYSGNKILPAAVAQSLAIYFAEHSKGAFANHFITFSRKPQLLEIKGNDLIDKVKYLSTFNIIENTNIIAVFQLILDTAIKNKTPQNELPSKIYIISDMEFDMCNGYYESSNFECAKKMFNEHGYELPTIVFWNVNSLSNQVPVKKDEINTVLVSGTSPRIFSFITGKDINPEQYMLDVLNSERYEKITA